MQLFSCAHLDFLSQRMQLLFNLQIQVIKQTKWPLALTYTLHIILDLKLDLDDFLNNNFHLNGNFDSVRHFEKLRQQGALGKIILSCRVGLGEDF